MSGLPPTSRPWSSPWSLAACAALLLSMPGHAVAAEEDARLEISWGPNQSDQVTLFAIKATLDGQPLPLRKPELNAAAARLVHEGPLPAGRHLLEVTVTLAGQNPVFSYVEEYHLDLSGRLEFASASASKVKAVVRIRDENGLSVAWADRYRLDLSAVGALGPVIASAGEEGPGESPPPAPVAEGTALAASAPPAGAPRAAERGPCAQELVHFALGQATISQRAEVELDKLATCLSRTGGSVKLVGHCDRRGSGAANLRLGRERADIVARFLQERGLPAARLSVESRGSSEPLCTQDTRDCHARNRRVEALVAAP